MTKLSLVAAILSSVSAAACSSSSSGEKGDASGMDAGVVDSCAPIDSYCGQPCDPGNSLGVGHYCNSFDDCAHVGMASLCSVAGNSQTHFCTFMCSLAPEGGAGDGGDGGDAGTSTPFPTSCGEGATCTCSGTLCGCTPSSCLDYP